MDTFSAASAINTNNRYILMITWSKFKYKLTTKKLPVDAVYFLHIRSVRVTYVASAHPCNRLESVSEVK
jgi:hypothetical protein